MSLGWLLFGKGDRHITAEMLFEEAVRARIPVLAEGDEKAASKWAAALEMAGHEGIAPKHFIAFLREIGGIEGAHRRRVRLRRKNRRH